MARIIYSFFFYLALPFIFIRLLYKAKRSRAYRHRWSERFGYFLAPKQTGGIWVHAVSVGETIAAVPMIKALQQAYPQKQIILTTMTPTGSERVRALFHDRVFHVYVPYDFPGAVKRFLAKTQPSLCILMETELWPNSLYYCHKQQIPVLLANARLSQRSFEGYKRIQFLVKKMLAQIAMIAAQAQPDAQRFIALGANPEQVVVTGSMKFDINIEAHLQQAAESLRKDLGAQRRIWIAASTHEGEDEKILQAFTKVRQVLPDNLLILVPRHPERFNKVAELCQKQGYNLARRSLQQTCTAATDIYLGDTMGELLLLYGASDLAVIGGSFTPIGGHNMLEPAALALPTIMGPHYFNFTTIVKLLQEMGGLVVVEDADALAKMVLSFLQDEHKRQQSGQQAQAVVAAHKGAVDKHLGLIKRIYA